jgi:hypothetical protein
MPRVSHRAPPRALNALAEIRAIEAARKTATAKHLQEQQSAAKNRLPNRPNR